MVYDVFIIGGGAAGMSCALVLGSAKEKAFAVDKKIGIIMHQKTSHLQTALFNNVLGLNAATTGADILEKGKEQLTSLYNHIDQVHNEKVMAIERNENLFQVTTNKTMYTSKIVVIAVGYTKLLSIKGLEKFIEPHQKAKPKKERIQLKNNDHQIEKGLYVAGTLAGWRSQFSIACGSGASVATDILTLWNNGEHTKVHDKSSPQPSPKEREF